MVKQKVATKEEVNDDLNMTPVPITGSPPAIRKVSSKLKAMSPEYIEKRLKLFVYGPSGIGKTTAAIQFPDAYIIDTEDGTDYYTKSINKSKSRVFHSNDFYEVKEQIEALQTETHNYKTLIIDPITHLYLSLQDHWAKRFEREAIAKGKREVAEMADWGMRFWAKVKGEFKALQRLLINLDMNVIITAHQKDVYGANSAKIGVTFDSMKGDDYVFDNVMHLEKRGKDRIAIVEKERAEINEPKFPDEFVWSYDNFLKFYGSTVIERKAIAMKLATPEQVEKLKELISTANIETKTVNIWLSKAKVSSFDDFTEDQITKCISFATEKIEKGAK